MPKGNMATKIYLKYGFLKTMKNVKGENFEGFEIA